MAAAEQPSESEVLVELPIGSRLHLSPAHRCFSTAELVKEVKRWTSDSVPEDLSILVEVSEDIEPPWTASFVLLGAGGKPLSERYFSGIAGDCRELKETLGLTIALALDAQRRDRARLPPPPGSSGPRAGVGFALWPALFQAPALTGELALGYLWWGMGRAELTLGASTVSHQEWEGGALEERWLYGGAQGCVVGGPHWEFCGGVRAGSVHGAGSGFVSNGSGDGPWISLVGRGTFQLQSRADFNWGAGLQAQAALLRPRWDLLGPDGSMAGTVTPAVLSWAPDLWIRWSLR